MGLYSQNPFGYILHTLCGFITPFIILHVIGWLLPLRQKRWVKPLLYTGCWIFAGMIIYVGDPVNLPGALLALLLAVFLCCEATSLQRVSIFFILSSLGLSFNALADSFLILKTGTWLIRNFLCMIIWLLVYFVLSRSAPKQEYSLPPRLWALLDILALTPFAATLITVLMGNGRIAADMRDALVLAVVTLSSFGLLWAMVVLARQQKLEQEKSFYNLNRMYYQNLEQEQFQVRRLRHDMANHLQTMAALPLPELRSYIGELIDSPAMKPVQRFCENNVANIVMAAKKAVSEQKNIEMSVEINVPQELPLQDAELCALFANSLDNAMEACEKLPEDKRKLFVKARTDKGLFALQVQNPLADVLTWKNGIPATTKQKTDIHGLGLAGIQEIAVRYGGSMNITTEEDLFTLLIYIPLGFDKEVPSPVK